MSKYYVDVTYRNEDMKPTQQVLYTLKEYCDMLQLDLFRLIGEVEDLVYVMNGCLPRSRWTDESWTRFNAIRHKMLDKAGDIGRLPETIREDSPKEGEPHGKNQI